MTYRYNIINILSIHVWWWKIWTLFFHNIIGFSYLHTKQHFWFLFLKSPATLSRKIPQTVVTLKPLCQIAVSIEKLHLNSIGRVDGRHFEEAQRWCRSGYTKISLKRLMSNSGRPKADIIVIILAYISLTAESLNGRAWAVIPTRARILLPTVYII